MRMDAYGLADVTVPSKQPKLPGMGSVEDGEEDKPDEAIVKPRIKAIEEKADSREDKK